MYALFIKLSFEDDKREFVYVYCSSVYDKIYYAHIIKLYRVEHLFIINYRVRIFNEYFFALIFHFWGLLLQNSYKVPLKLMPISQR